MVEENFTKADLMATVMAHHLRDDEVAIMGAYSMIPMLACRLAQLTHAPNLTFIAGGSGAINPKLEPLVASSCDARLTRAECVFSLSDVIDLEAYTRINVFFAGGLQIDKYGNCNLIGIGTSEGMKFRGPGSVGLPFLSRAKRFVIYTHSHNPRIFVEKVDFISGPGFLDGKSYKDEITGSGPSLVVTPLCVMDFDKETKIMRLQSVHPGVTVNSVLENTGFKPVLSEFVSETNKPTNEELEILKKLDPKRIARDNIK